MQIQRISVNAQLLKQVVDGRSQVVKGIGIRRRWRGFAVAEAGKVRRHDMIVSGEQGNQTIELTRRRGEAMQQHDGRCRALACFAVKEDRGPTAYPPALRAAGGGSASTTWTIGPSVWGRKLSFVTNNVAPAVSMVCT